MNLLLEITANSASPSASSALILIGLTGLLAATTLGSIAWYNSKRPVGWEDKERPDFVPDIDD